MEFKEDIEKEKIKETIENSYKVREIFLKHKERLEKWWKDTKIKIEKFEGNNNLWIFRKEALKRLKDLFLPLRTLDEFKVAGIFVNWWEDLRYDFKSIISSGWSKNLIEDEKIKRRFFEKEVKEMEEIENKILEVKSQLNELLEEIEDWDEGENGKKTSNNVKKHLKELIKNLRSTFQESALKEAAKWENLLKKIESKDKELKKLRRELKEKTKELEQKIEEKRSSLTEKETRDLLLEKFYEIIEKQMGKYLNAEKKEIIKTFEKLWDKYKVSLSEIIEERDKEVERLNEFLRMLRYYNG